MWRRPLRRPIEGPRRRRSPRPRVRHGRCRPRRTLEGARPRRPGVDQARRLFNSGERRGRGPDAAARAPAAGSGRRGRVRPSSGGDPQAAGARRGAGSGTGLDRGARRAGGGRGGGTRPQGGHRGAGAHREAPRTLPLMAQAQKITPRAKDFSEWYNDVVMQAELADYSPVRGCMVIRPHGYRVWELMQQALDDMFKATGHQNAYFPLFIPMSFLAKEAEHVEGFAKEVALVTHTRLKATGKTGAQAVMPDPESALEEPLVVRPTSETIIYAMFAKWIQSYRDLPLLMNQWCNIVRWEFRTRLFLRTTEFLWQEGHTAHATEAEAEAEARQMLGVYRKFQEDWMAMPVITGRKTDSEKFAGALRTYALEALMQDNKALQAGTSHNLGQNFAKAFNVQYQTAAGGLEYVWNTSWGVSTRMIGGLVMTHSDDNGLVCPPKLAPVQVVIVPIWKSEEEKSQVLAVGGKVKEELARAGVRVELDSRDSLKPGAKYFEWEAKGVPLRLEIGPRDVAAGQVMTARRTGGKAPAKVDGLGAVVRKTLDEIQATLFQAAKDRREAHSIRGVTKQQFIEFMKGAGGFAFGGFCGSPECEAQIKQQTGATVRVLPDPEFRSAEAPKICAWCGKPSLAEAVWAQAY